MMTDFGKKIEIVNLLILEEDFAAIPGDTLFDHPFAAPEPIPDLQRAFGETDRARAGRQTIVVVDKQSLYSLLGEVYCSREPNRPGSNDDHRMVRHVSVALIWRAHVVEDYLLKIGVVSHNSLASCQAQHVSLPTGIAFSFKPDCRPRRL